MITQSLSGQCLARRSYSEGGCQLVSGQHCGGLYYIRGWKPLPHICHAPVGAASSREEI